MRTASTGGSPSSGIGGSCRRVGPKTGDGETRWLQTGSTRTRAPSTSSSALACPNQVTASSAASAGSAVCASGIGPPGHPTCRSSCHCRSRPSRVFAGASAGVSRVLWNLPSDQCGEPATSGRRRRRWAPSAVGRPQAARVTQPTGKASAAAVSAVRRRAERDTRSSVPAGTGQRLGRRRASHPQGASSGGGGGISGQGWQHRALGSIACFWLLAAWLAVGSALHSDWPPFGQAPTPEQIQAARQAAWGAAAVATLPLLGGLLLAGWWRMVEWAIAFGVLLMFAVLGSGFLVALADG